MNLKSLKVNAFFNVIYTLMNIIFPVVTYPYILRVLTVDEVGVVNFFSSLSVYAVMLADLGIGIYGIRAVSKVRENKEKLAGVVKELLYINFISTAFILVAYVLLCVYIDRLSVNVYLVILNFIYILSAPFAMNWLFAGVEDYSYIAKRSFVIKFIMMILIFAFVNNHGDYIIYAGIISLSSVMVSVCNWCYARKIVCFNVSYNLEYIKHLRPMLILFGSSLAVSVYVNLDTVMLGFICDDREVGLYTTGVKIKSVLLSLVNAISVVMLPRLSYYIEKKMNTDYDIVLRKSIELIFLITLPMTAFFIIKSHECIYILGGEKYVDAILCMQILMPILIISGFSNIIGNQVLIPMGRDSEFTKAVSLGALVDIILNLILMRPYGCYGAAIATLIAEGIQMSYQLKCSKNVLEGSVNYEVIKRIILGTMITTLIIMRTNTIFQDNAILNIIISALLYVLFYFMCLYYLKIIYVRRFATYIKHKIECIFL